jgi:copper homeostasis protein CutC
MIDLDMVKELMRWAWNDGALWVLQHNAPTSVTQVDTAAKESVNRILAETGTESFIKNLEKYATQR